MIFDSMAIFHGTMLAQKFFTEQRLFVIFHDRHEKKTKARSGRATRKTAWWVGEGIISPTLGFHVASGLGGGGAPFYD